MQLRQRLQKRSVASGRGATRKPRSNASKNWTTTYPGCLDTILGVSPAACPSSTASANRLSAFNLIAVARLIDEVMSFACFGSQPSVKRSVVVARPSVSPSAGWQQKFGAAQNAVYESELGQTSAGVDTL